MQPREARHRESPSTKEGGGKSIGQCENCVAEAGDRLQLRVMDAA